MYSLFILLITMPEEHVKGSSSIILSKLPSSCLKLHGWKDLVD